MDPADTADRRERPFSLLVVCTGNICRSPVAERLLAARLGTGAVVGSAGTHAVSGAPIFTPMAELLDASGGSTSGFRARQLTPQLLRDADLVLTMTRQQRGTAVQTWPGCVRRAFMLVEFARLLRMVGPHTWPPGCDSLDERLRVAIPLAVAQRGQVIAPADADDVADPYRRSTASYLSAFSQISDAVASITTALS